MKVCFHLHLKTLTLVSHLKNIIYKSFINIYIYDLLENISVYIYKLESTCCYHVVSFHSHETMVHAFLIKKHIPFAFHPNSCAWSRPNTSFRASGCRPNKKKQQDMLGNSFGFLPSTSFKNTCSKKNLCTLAF